MPVVLSSVLPPYRYILYLELWIRQTPPLSCFRQSVLSQIQDGNKDFSYCCFNDFLQNLFLETTSVSLSLPLSFLTVSGIQGLKRVRQVLCHSLTPLVPKPICFLSHGSGDKNESSVSQLDPLPCFETKSVSWGTILSEVDLRFESISRLRRLWLEFKFL